MLTYLSTYLFIFGSQLNYVLHCLHGPLYIGCLFFYFKYIHPMILNLFIFGNLEPSPPTTSEVTTLEQPSVEGQLLRESKTLKKCH